MHARAVSADRPTDVLIFRSQSPELEVLTDSGYPFYRLEWGPHVVGMILHADVDWAEVDELLMESYCVQAPKKLIRLIDRPAG